MIKNSNIKLKKGTAFCLKFLNLKTMPYAIRKGKKSANNETGPLLNIEKPKNIAAKNVFFQVVLFSSKKVNK